MPFGGVKDSGWGRFGGQAVIDEFTELRWITVQSGSHPFPFWRRAVIAPPCDAIASLSTTATSPRSRLLTDPARRRPRVRTAGETRPDARSMTPDVTHDQLIELDGDRLAAHAAELRE